MALINNKQREEIMIHSTDIITKQHTFTINEAEYDALLHGIDVFAISGSVVWDKAKFTLSFKGTKAIRGILAKDHSMADVFTYAVVDENGDLEREFFNSDDAKRYATNNGYETSDIVSLCNGLSEDNMH